MMIEDVINQVQTWPPGELQLSLTLVKCYSICLWHRVNMKKNIFRGPQISIMSCLESARPKFDDPIWILVTQF